ncbi:MULTISPECIES: LLM class flavin-dependent oxidoreductase [Nocardiaceae]|uniref:LLM class flavin-dependent oxidoreductase n=1 Tax=Rhodococcoides kroppenstedtii TaxID=293050 RepID=A0ABS7NZZ4_9NOCA|nr:MULTISPECIES: LLM class flavin-dependent oxidoreductase [Rhodococcus]AMY21232.1 Alkanal monooxygenase alpha chain [Rhodococcus sp. PBTS 1]MBY6314640.1 LLM class flavin-dependent oxidoreductase [Rhodococcus kroppenstedtii]MBY6322447.1 LLM class flavin-dependent oxidoreductase [Rhodococcus kroppenstedtii]MBY6401251.1 LLM class flavin-dependent oxidoreductase [Rhodococcus kroppenstedtii]
MVVSLSVLDLAHIAEGRTAADSFAASVALAQAAEESGYRRVWYAEHHNMPSIASSATSVVIAHVAAYTSTIRLGAGGVMLPNHSPLTIAEQFGTLETLHPGRIDLGLGRAPGSDQNTMRALRRDPSSADTFPQDVLELQAYLAGTSRVPGVAAVPGAGTNVPLYILGSSLFGAQLAAHLGLPYANASHFAPDSLGEAVSVYRETFRPSASLAEPYVIAGVNAVVSESAARAHELLEQGIRRRVVQMVGRGQTFTPEEVDLIMDSPAGRQIQGMTKFTAVGTPAEASSYITQFADRYGVDEVIVASGIDDTEERLASYRLLAQEHLHAAVA